MSAVINETEDKKETKKKSEKITIAKLIIRRTISGVSIMIKSKTLEEFFKSAYGEETSVITRNNWAQGERFYKGDEGANHPTVSTDRYQVIFNGTDNNNLITQDEKLNLTFMRVKGISEGKTFNFNGLYRESDVTAIAQAINEAMKNLFKEYNTPTCYEIELNAEK